MKDILKTLKKIFSPHMALLVLLNIASIILLCYVFMNGYDASPVAYISYVISAYSLTADVVNFVPIVRKIKNFKNNNKYLQRYFSDRRLQVTISLYMSLFINIAYTLVNFFISNKNSSVWYASVGVYYLVLGLIRFFLLKNSDKANKKLSKERKIFELKIYRATGIMMFIVNGVMSGMTVQMVKNNECATHSNIMTIATAAFTFYFFSMAIVNLQKYRKTDHPIFSATKMLNFACALMSIFTLQTSMIPAFGDDETFRKIMNTATGSAVFILVFGLALYMICRANKMLKEVNNG